MPASAVSAPTAVTSTVSSPSVFSAPPVTRAPGRLATGRLSPVSIDSSTLAAPSITFPSTGMRSPGRTITTSPTRTRSSGTTVPSRRRAVSGRSFTRAAMAEAVRPTARASSQRPNSTKVMMRAADSKYSAGIRPGGVAIRLNRLSANDAEVPSATSRSMLPVNARSAFQPAT